MIIYGYRGDVLDVADAGVHHCANCGTEQRFRVRLAYRYAHLYFLFGVVIRRRYQMLCSVCQHGWELDTKKVKPMLPAVPIPFMHRYGLLVLGCVIAVVIGLNAH